MISLEKRVAPQGRVVCCAAGSKTPAAYFLLQGHFLSMPFVYHMTKRRKTNEVWGDGIVQQLNYYETIEKMPKFDIDCVLYICDITSENLGLILRSADIFGATEVYYCCGFNTVSNRKLTRLSRNSTTKIHFVDTEDSILSRLKKMGYTILALEITDTSVPLRTVSLRQKICLVVGNERNGVPENILGMADLSGHIEMPGIHIASLNVAVATSIALYEISRQHLN